MVKSLSSEVLSKVDEIVKYIEESDNYKKFKKIEDKMILDKDIMSKISQVKSLQKKIVKLEIDKKDISLLEEEIESIISELNTYPIYLEYSYLLEDLNSTFQEIKFILENYLNKKLN